MAAVGIVALFVVIAIALVVAGFVFAGRASSADEPVRVPANRDELRYDVPAGIDSAIVLATLHHEGYEATADVDNQPVVVITGEAGSLDRERIRELLRSVPFREGHEPAGIQEVRFTDE